MTIMTELTADLMKIKRGGDELVQTGNEHLITVLDGWRGTTMRRSTSERVTGNGDLSERGTMAGRVLTVGGESVFSTELEAEQFVLQLQRFLADGQVGIVEVEEVTLGVTLQLAVELNTFDEPVTIGTTVGWNYELYAADPAKYGLPELFEPEVDVIEAQPIYETLPRNVVRVHNRTASTTTLWFTITNGVGAASPVITDMGTGATFTCTWTMDAASDETWELRGDSKSLYIYRNGQYYGAYGDSYGQFVGAWHTIQPGTSKLFRITNDNTKADSGTRDIKMVANITGQTEKFTATYNKGGNPTYDTQIGMTEASTTVGNTIVTNSGAMTTRATFIITGSFPEGVTVFEANSGRLVTVYGAVTATEASPLVIDSNKGKATLGSVDISTRLTERQWVDIAPGATASFQLSGAGMTNQNLTGKVETKWN